MSQLPTATIGPGFGGSDPSPGRTVADHAHDLGELMSVLGHRRFSVVGVFAGAPYALALAAAIPGCEARVHRTGGHFFYSHHLPDILGSLVPGVVGPAAEPEALLRAA